MIYLTKGQKLFDNPSLVVYDQTGYYNDGDSVICAGVTSPNEPICRYEAKFVAYGGIVYSVADPDALMEQILAIDPKTLFGKDSQQVAVDKMVEAIVPQESGVLTEDATTEVVDTATTTPEINVQTPQTSTTTPQVNLPPTSQTSTTTPEINTSTTTPEFIAPDTSSSTTTPQSSTSTTTPVMVLPDTSATSTPSSNVSTTTPIDISITPPATDISSTTPSIAPNVIDTPAAIPSTLETPTDTSATSSEVVAFAKNIIKKKITKKLGL